MHKIIHPILADIFSLLALHITKLVRKRNRHVKIEYKKEKLLWSTLKPDENLIFLVKLKCRILILVYSEKHIYIQYGWKN